MSMELARNIRVRCSYCGEILYSDENGKIVYPRNKNNKGNLYMELYEIKCGENDIVNFVGFTCPNCGTNILSNINLDNARYK